MRFCRSCYEIFKRCCVVFQLCLYCRLCLQKIQTKWLILIAGEKKISHKWKSSSFPLFDLTLLPVYIKTAIKVKLRVEFYLFLLASKILSCFKSGCLKRKSVIRKIRTTEHYKPQHIISYNIIYNYGR